jgi:hypothetical protein
MSNEPVAYINVEERKLEWAEPITWHTPTIAQMDKIPLYIMPNAKPVAWRCKNFYENQEGWFYNENQIGEPLYTHPAKTLTDEEIMEQWYPLDLHDEAWVDDAVLRDFARAILRKAQEK